MNTYDVVYNERTRVYAVFVTTAAGATFHTSHAYTDEADAWTYVLRCEAFDRRNNR